MINNHRNNFFKNTENIFITQKRFVGSDQSSEQIGKSGRRRKSSYTDRCVRSLVKGNGSQALQDPELRALFSGMTLFGDMTKGPVAVVEFIQRTRLSFISEAIKSNPNIYRKI